MRLSDILDAEEIATLGEQRCELDDCACRGSVHDAREES